MEDYSKDIQIGSKVIIESTEEEGEVIQIKRTVSGFLSLPLFNLYYIRLYDGSPPIWKMRIEILLNNKKPEIRRGKYIF